LEERERTEKERGERERKRRKKERCDGRGYNVYPIANSRKDICKKNGKKEEKWQ